MPIIETERYEINPQPIGKGGFGEVYLARDLLYDRDVVVKTIKSSGLFGLDDPTIRRRFFREAVMSAKLSNLTPYVVKVYDYGYDRNGELPFFVLEYISGGDLRSSVGRMPWEGAAKVLSDGLTALWVAHRHDVIHSDISPDNILVDKDNYKLNDFGLAKQLTSALMSRAHSASLTGGKPRYLPPDHWHSNLRNEYSDLYGLAVTVFEQLTGEIPQFHYSSSIGQLIAPNWSELLNPLRAGDNPWLLTNSFDGNLEEQSVLAVDRLEVVTDKTMSRIAHWFLGFRYHVRPSRSDIADVLEVIFTRRATTTAQVVDLVRKEIARYAKYSARSLRSANATRRKKKDDE